MLPLINGVPVNHLEQSGTEKQTGLDQVMEWEEM